MFPTFVSDAILQNRHKKGVMGNIASNSPLTPIGVQYLGILIYSDTASSLIGESGFIIVGKCSISFFHLTIQTKWNDTALWARRLMSVPHGEVNVIFTSAPVALYQCPWWPVTAVNSWLYMLFVCLAPMQGFAGAPVAVGLKNVSPLMWPYRSCSGPVHISLC